MTTFWTYDHLAQVTAGAWRVTPADGGVLLPAAARALAPDNDCRGPVLWHDTRELVPGQCYLAIKGDNFDGHAFVDQAFEQGAAMAIVNADADPQATCPGQRGGEHATAPATHPPSAIRHPPSPRPILEVADTVKALQDLARAYRDELASGGCKVIGVAGSNGKTTTRHLIHHVLTHAGKTGTQSPKSFNNHLGVPLTLLAALPTDDFVACEIGTNHPGEIDHLSAIARPDIAVITSIGEEHLEFFGDIEGVLKEELSIIPHVPDGGQVVTGHLRNAIGLAQLEKYHTRGRVSLHHYADAENQPPRDLRMIGHHTRENAAMAGAVARLCSTSFPEWYEAMKSATPPPHRGEVHRLGESVVVIDDAYNANPSSMTSALMTLGREVQFRQGSRGVAVLGEMFELGEHALAAHRDVGDFARDADCEVSLFIAIGEHAKAMADAFDYARSVVFPEWTDDLPDQVAALLQPGDTVLLKASRGMRLERLVPAIEERFGKAGVVHET